MGKLSMSKPCNIFKLGGSKQAPLTSAITPLKSRTRPWASSKPGFSAPDTPYRNSFMLFPLVQTNDLKNERASLTTSGAGRLNQPN
jgi:hypothetical protein